MLQWIIGSSINFRLLVIAIAAALLAAGVAQVREASVEALPDFGPVRVEVQTEALGLSPEEVENLITNPMEQEFFNGIPWLHKIRSDSINGLSSVEMIFEPGTDPVRARQVVQERLTMVPALPQVSKPPFVIQPTATTARLMMIGLSSKEFSLIDLSVLARWKIRQRLLAVPGVANVSIWGFRDRQLQVLIDPQRLRRRDVKVEDVIRTAANAMWSSPLTYVEASTPGTGGFIDTAHQRIGVNHIQPIRTAKDLAQVTVEGDQARPRTLGEVSDIVEMHQPLIGDGIVNGKPGVMLVVERFPGASIGRTTREVERVLEAMRPGLKGVEVDTTVFRSVSFVETTRENLAGSLAIGAALLVLALGAFLYSWRLALVSVATIALGFAVAWLVLAAYGAMLNMMIVAGLTLALAVVVDDAVVDVDNIRRRLASRGTASVSDTVAAAVQEIRAPLVTALAVVVVCVVPLLVLTGVAGDFLRPIATAYVLAVVASTAAALTVTPALAAMLLGGAAPARRPAFAERLEAGYAAAVRQAVQRPLAAVIPAAVIVAAGLAALPALLAQLPLLPELKDRNVLVRLKAAPGTSLPAMLATATTLDRELRAIPGVKSIGGHIGRASNSDVVSGVDTADLWVSIDAKADYETAAEGIRAAAASFPGVRASVSAYANQRIREVTAEATDDLVVRVYGRSYEVLAAKAELVAKSIASVAGVAAPQVRLPAVEPTVEVEVFIPQAAARGIKPGDVRRGAATWVAGITAGNLFEEQKIFDVVVWTDAEKRENLASIKDVLLDTPDGDQVRLGDVADVRIRPNPSTIKHDAVSRYIDVVADVQGRSIRTVGSDVEARLQDISFPSEHHVEVLGDSAERQADRRMLVGYAAAAAIAVLFLLQASFTGWRLAGAYFLLLVLSLAGATLGAFAMRGGVSVLSLTGALAVLAVAVRGGLLLVARLQRLEREGEPFGPELVVKGASERFGPVLLSTAAAALALLPLVGYGIATGLEIVAPLAATVIGGLVAAAILNLLVLPALYLRLARPGLASAGPLAAAQ